MHRPTHTATAPPLAHVGSRLASRVAGYFALRVTLQVAVLVLLGCASGVRAQPLGVLQLDDPIHQFLEKQQTLGRLPEAHLTHQPLSGGEARAYLDTLRATHFRGDGPRERRLHPADRRLLERFRGEAPGPNARGIHERFGALYRNGNDLYSASGDGYALHINPLLHAGYGPALPTGRADWHYDRGLRLSGDIGRWLFFEGRLTEGLRRPVWNTYVPGDRTADRFGFVALDDGAYSFFTTTGVLGVRIPHVELRLAHDRNQWGPARASLVLSDYAPVYDHVQLRATLGRAQYTTVLAGLAEPRLQPKPGNAVNPRKYAAFHRLALKLPAGIEIAFYESVVFGTDSLGARTGFDWSYANPLVFYRAVERDRGSPDNALLGGSLSWVVRPGARLYTDLLLDELKVDQIGKGWWGNKWGWLAGAHLVPAQLLQGLSIRAEYARLRPYLYSHRDARSDYVHYRDVLGHPAGPNAVDLALFVDFQPSDRWQTALNLAFTRRGRNGGGVNYGGDPLVPYSMRPSDFDVEILQGIRVDEWLVELYGGYELLPRLHLELAVVGRARDDEERGRSSYVAPQIQMRWGMPFRSLRY